MKATTKPSEHAKHSSECLSGFIPKQGDHYGLDVWLEQS